MDLIKWSFTAMIGSNLLVVIVLAYLYLLNRERYMGIWALGWLLHVLQLVWFDLAQTLHFFAVMPFLDQFLGIMAGMLLIWGVYVFLGWPFSRLWVFAAFIATLAGILPDRVPVFLKTLPALWLAGVMIAWTGVLFIRCRQIDDLGKYVTGGACILLGAYNLFQPVTTRYAMLPWNLYIGVVLHMLIALGIMQIHFNIVRTAIIGKARYYRLITENAQDIIYRFQYAPRPVFEYVSPAVIEVTGYTPADYYADPELEIKITHPADRQALKAFRAAPDITSKPVVFRMIKKDGTFIWTEHRGVPIYDDNGIIIAFEGIVRDITDRKRLEQDMARLEGLNAIGQMAANIAHEIRNPMTTVRGYLQLLGGKREFSAYKDEFALLLSELDRTNSIITEYLALSKGKLANLTLGQINDVILAMLPLIQADANAKGKVIKTELTEIPDVCMDEKEIRQLILNLVRNGMEAMETGGELIIGTLREQNGVTLMIKDHGKGIPADILGKVGTPFFTTKENGTGLGLAVCYRIATRHRAGIELETGSDGTAFYVRFPLPETDESCAF